jgi:hypothetical protein
MRMWLLTIAVSVAIGLASWEWSAILADGSIPRWP